MKPLVLFDIDSTLVKWSPAHYEAFQEAYRQVYGVEGKHERPYHGMTDQTIIFHVISNAGLDQATILAKLPQALQVMATTYEHLVQAETITVLPGVRELLSSLQQRGAVLGLVTGNIQPIARAKLSKAGLWNYFLCGGFGSDDRERSRMVTIAISRAREHGFSGSLSDVIVVGDSPLDIVAAHGAGVRGFGVATSDYSVDELKAAGAEVALPSFADTQATLAALSVS